MNKRSVRVDPQFFTELDIQLGESRGPNGEPSASDFLLVDLPTLSEVFSERFEELPTLYPGRDDYRYLGLGDSVTLIVHDWGSGLGFDWARRHPDRVVAIAYLEANVAPRSWSQLSSTGREIFEALRTPAGEKMALEDNFFIASSRRVCQVASFDNSPRQR